MNAIDLRSDTVTHPTEAMREAMARARVGDDGYHDDPTVIELEELAAATLGKKAAVFVASGTMANLVAQLAHSGRGGEVLVEATSHILRSEMGGVASISGMFHKALPGHRGAIDLDALSAAISPGLSPTRLGTSLVWVENTHNAAGGTVMPPAYLAEVRAIADRHGVPVHMDGARIFNAQVALGVPAKEIASHADSVCFCLSKGLSAPVGSLFCGPAEVVMRARAFRRMLGGTMRQAGVVAAAGVVAIRTMIDRLADDHANAKSLAKGLHGVDPSLVAPAGVETNIVRIDVAASGRSAADWSADLKARGLLCNVFGPTILRMVAHRQVSAADVDRAVAIFADAWRAPTSERARATA